jgi:hypothetical protein
VFLGQGRFACIAGLAALVVSTARGGLPRVLAVTSALYVVIFMLLSTQFDRYVLAPWPWIAVLIGSLVARAQAAWGLRGALAASVAAGAMVAESSRAALPSIVPERQDVRADPQRALHAWLIENARSPATIWIEADAWPLLQATFADPGGPLQLRMREAFRRAYPDFQPIVLKGERVETHANFDPALISGGKVHYAFTCASYVDYARQSGHDTDWAIRFYEALDRTCHQVQTSPDRCWIEECPKPPA